MILPKYLLLPVLAIAMLGSCAQPNKVDQTETHKKVFEAARRANDFGTALGAAYQIVYASDSNYAYYDSIALIYQTLGNYVGALEASKDGLEKHPSLLLEKVAAHSMMKIGKFSDAIIKYQELLKSDPENNVKYLYAIGEGFFYMQNYQSCMDYMNQVATNDRSALMDIEMETDGSVQRVPYKLAAFNTMGYVMMLTERFDEAERFLGEALSKMPDFKLALNNKQLLNELQKGK